MDRSSIFKPSLGEVKNWLTRQVSEVSKMGLRDCETSLRGLKNGLVRLVSEKVENQRKLNFQT